MINIEKVKIVLATMLDGSVEDIEKLNPIISNSVSVISKLVNSESYDDERAVYLAAVKANYDISLISNGDDVTSFAAGDVKITKGNSHDSAKKLLDGAMSDASDLINDNGFAFLGV